MVKIRLTRMGRRNRPFYRIVVVDSRKRRDGTYIDSLGFYDPLKDPAVMNVRPIKKKEKRTKNERASRAHSQRDREGS